MLLYFQIMPTHRANSKAKCRAQVSSQSSGYGDTSLCTRAVLRQEKEKTEAVTPLRRTPALHATPLQALLRQESVTLSRGTPFHSATLHYIHSISPTLQHRATPHAFRYVSARHNRPRCQRAFQYYRKSEGLVGFPFVSQQDRYPMPLRCIGSLFRRHALHLSQFFAFAGVNTSYILCFKKKRINFR